MARRHAPRPVDGLFTAGLHNEPAARPADLTGFDLVMGQAKSYAGGYSSSKGTSTKPIEDPGARIGGVPNAQRDLSRAADWHWKGAQRAWLPGGVELSHGGP